MAQEMTQEMTLDDARRLVKESGYQYEPSRVSGTLKEGTIWYEAKLGDAVEEKVIVVSDGVIAGLQG